MSTSDAGRIGALPPDPRDNWASLDLAARNAAYDNNAAAADSASWIERRNRESAVYRAMHNTAIDLPYAVASPRTAFDLYPATDPDAPCLVFIHGGYWQRNSREVFACFTEGPVAAGWSVAIPGYTLAPQTNLTGIVTEIGIALDWLVACQTWNRRTSDHLRLVGGCATCHIAAQAPKRRRRTRRVRRV
jgi:arylformamidase